MIWKKIQSNCWVKLEDCAKIGGVASNKAKVLSIGWVASFEHNMF